MFGEALIVVLAVLVVATVVGFGMSIGVRNGGAIYEWAADQRIMKRTKDNVLKIGNAVKSKFSRKQPAAVGA